MKWSLSLLSAAVLLAGCTGPLEDQPKYKTYAPSRFFDDGRSARPLVADTVPWDGLEQDPWLEEGVVGGRFVTKFPFPITKEVLERGRERYDIYCAVCHGRTGRADGEVVRRGFPKPPDYHGELLRRQEAGALYAAITHGYGMMYSYADRVSVRDRWAIVAYIRALQLSGRAPVALLSDFDRRRLQESSR